MEGDKHGYVELDVLCCFTCSFYDTDGDGICTFCGLTGKDIVPIGICSAHSDYAVKETSTNNKKKED